MKFYTYFSPNSSLFILTCSILLGSCGPETAASSRPHMDSKCGQVQESLDQKIAELEKLKLEADVLKTDNTSLRNAASNLRDPTWQELKSFLHTSKMDEGKYDGDDFNCMHFSISLRDKARDRGFRAAFVNFYYEGKSVGHAIVAFDTLDAGKIYVEPQGNRIAYLKTGQVYGTIGMKHVKRKYYACPSSSSDFKNRLNLEIYEGNLFEYDYFTNYQSRAECYNQAIEKYNQAVKRYNSNFSSDTIADLDMWKNNLALLEADLGSYSFERDKVSKMKSLWP